MSSEELEDKVKELERKVDDLENILDTTIKIIRKLALNIQKNNNNVLRHVLVQTAAIITAFAIYIIFKL